MLRTRSVTVVGSAIFRQQMNVFWRWTGWETSSDDKGTWDQHVVYCVLVGRYWGVTHCPEVEDALVCHFLSDRPRRPACYYPFWLLKERKKKKFHLSFHFNWLFLVIFLWVVEEESIFQMTAVHQAWCETTISLVTTGDREKKETRARQGCKTGQKYQSGEQPLPLFPSLTNRRTAVTNCPLIQLGCQGGQNQWRKKRRKPARVKWVDVWLDTASVWRGGRHRNNQRGFSLAVESLQNDDNINPLL